ncbi:hypothetical protein BVY01_02990 [bacterium I07]|nr:hypothetical protein BVY01_02990 [bacterium I07]
MIGQVISHFKILEKLGEGGMGVVYKAHDTKLNRTVALKFLPPELTRDPEAKERFIHEARAASALRHNNICTIHEVDETDEGQIFICMDLYEGQTLKEKIKVRPLKLEEAIDISIQISKGLTEAHQAGIIHRDIKPANIVITKKNEVKILDFGLAKLTGQTKLTKVGSTLGTAAYMSPEQLKGNPVDHRTDIWALGVMMYEILTGQLPFKGDYEQAITYAILNEEPEPITALRTGIPVALEGIVMKAMAKDPKQRYQHVDEVPVDLVNVESQIAGRTKQFTNRLLTKKEKSKAIFTRVLPWAVTVSMTIIALFMYFRSVTNKTQVTKRTHIVFPENAQLDPLGSTIFRKGRQAFDLSPDGKYLVYVANKGENTQLYLRNLNNYEINPIVGTSGASNPFFSYNSEWIGFFVDNKMKKVSVHEGSVIPLCDVNVPFGASWGASDGIVYSHAAQKLIWMNGDGVPQDTIETDNYWPQLLPDGKTVLASSRWPFGIKLIDIETKEVKFLREGIYSNPKYLSTGHIVYVHRNFLKAVKFDLKNKRIVGKPVILLDDIRIDSSYWVAQWAFSQDGTMVYLPGGSQVLGKLAIISRTGEEEILPFPEKEFGMLDVSPDGKNLAVTVFDEESVNIYKYDLQRHISERITFEGNNSASVWTPNGDWITFKSDRGGIVNIYNKKADESGVIETLLNDPSNYPYPAPSSWSPTDPILAIYYDGNQDRDIRFITKEEQKETNQTWSARYSQLWPTFSPDGGWIGYMSNDEGEWNAYVSRYPDGGAKVRISMESCGEPLWSPNTQEILYFSMGGEKAKWMSVPYNITYRFEAGTPKKIFEVDYLDMGGRNWDILPDGRILLLKPAKKQQLHREIHVVLNWFDEIESKFEAEN